MCILLFCLRRVACLARGASVATADPKKKAPCRLANPSAAHQGAVLHDQLQLKARHHRLAPAALPARCSARAAPGQLQLLLIGPGLAAVHLLLLLQALLCASGAVAALGRSWGGQGAQQVGVDLRL